MPSTIISTVKELFVPEDELEAVKEEAGKLPSLNITKVEKNSFFFFSLSFYNFEMSWNL